MNTWMVYCAHDGNGLTAEIDDFYRNLRLQNLLREPLYQFSSKLFHRQAAGMNLADQRQIDGTAWIDPQWLVRDLFHAEYPKLEFVVLPKYRVRRVFLRGRGTGHGTTVVRDPRTAG